ncbi:hypothetical protein [Knoellia sp. LjRoot47]|uniref:hypothetical protein n=1 Tax=Knoellia sp. LjRoot47 TaxID=3342330 RepID=UPI003ECDE2AB
MAVTIPASGTSANAAEPSPGRPVPHVAEDAELGTRMGLFSPELAGITRETYRPGQPQDIELRSTDDGSVAARVPYEPGTDTTALSGRTLLKTSPGYWYESNQVVATDAVSGAPRWTITVPAGEFVASVGESWVLSADQDHHAILRRPGQPVRVVEGMELSWPTSAGPTIVGDSTGLLVTNGTGAMVQQVDLDTAKATELPTTGDRARIVAGPTKWFVVSWDNSTQTRTVAWWDRRGPGSGSATLPGTEDYYAPYVAYGDGLARLQNVDGRTYSLHAVDLDSGAWGPPLLSGASEIRSLGDGRLVAHLTDTPNGRVVVLEDGKPVRTLVDLPEIGRPARTLALDGGRVHTGYGYVPEGETWSAPADGSGPALRRTDASGPVPGLLSSADGGTVITRTGDAPNSGFVISWPGGRRTVTGSHVELTLGAGGVVVRRNAPGGSTYEYARTGAALGTPSDPNTATAVDGTTEWTGPDAQGRLTGRDLATGSSRLVQTGATTCDNAPLMARGRWVLARCNNVWQILDTTGMLKPRPLAGTQNVWPALGAGFASWTEWTSAGGRIVVRDLGAGFTTRTFGPLSSYGSVVAPATDAPMLAWLDDALLARVADLDWLTAAPTTTDDTVGPTITSVGGSPPHTNQALFAAWTAQDTTASTTQHPSGLSSYDVRYQQPVHQQSPSPTAWLTAAWSSSLTTTRVALPDTTGRDTCWSVRARDRAGNVGPWSAVSCVNRDTVAPVIAAPTVGPRVVPATTTRTVTYSFQVGVNGQDWTSTDIAYRRASSGAGYGPWVQPTAWTNAQAASQRGSVSVGQDLCFRARARDAAGNIGPWATPVCTSVPFDDRSLAVAGRTSRTTSSMALSGTTTTLSAIGAQVSRSGQTGSKVSVVALRGPGQGTVDVYVGRKKIGQIGLNATKWSRATVTLTTAAFSNAAITVRSASSKPARVDALAILRS